MPRYRANRKLVLKLVWTNYRHEFETKQGTDRRATIVAR